MHGVTKRLKGYTRQKRLGTTDLRYCKAFYWVAGGNTVLKWGWFFVVTPSYGVPLCHGAERVRP